MWFLGLGLLQILLHLAGIGFMAHWNWHLTGDLWKFAWPFVCTVVWWTWADESGYNKRLETEAMAQNKLDRRMKNLERLGLNFGRGRKKR